MRLQTARHGTHSCSCVLHQMLQRLLLCNDLNGASLHVKIQSTTTTAQWQTKQEYRCWQSKQICDPVGAKECGCGSDQRNGRILDAATTDSKRHQRMTRNSSGPASGGWGRDAMLLRRRLHCGCVRSGTHSSHQCCDHLRLRKCLLHNRFYIQLTQPAPRLQRHFRRCGLACEALLLLRPRKGSCTV